MKDKLNVKLIEKYIKTNNLSIKNFCKQCNISTSTFYRIMQGKDFNLLSLFRIAKNMNLPIHEFFS